MRAFLKVVGTLRSSRTSNIPFLKVVLVDNQTDLIFFGGSDFFFRKEKYFFLK